MKKLMTLTLLLLLLNNLYGQTIRDSVFNNVIPIDKTDVTTNGADFLIDIPIKPQKEPIVIFSNDKRIPTNLFFDRRTFLSEQKELFLITFDWEFEKEIREREKREGIHIKAARHKIYHIQRNYDNYQVDSTTIALHSRPIVKLNFTIPKLEDNEMKLDYVENYGSICCPKDERHFFSKVIEKDIKLFEDKNGVTISVESIITGKEGEKTKNYKLDNLTNEQKLQFFQIFKKADRVENKIYVPIIRSTKMPE